MAIFGCFSDIPLPDVMSLIGSSTGTLTVSRYDNQHVYLFGIQNAVITDVRFNGQEIVDKNQARSFITELIQTNLGDFEFERGKSTTGSHSLPISEILNSSLSLIDEIQAFREHFPDPHTVFIAIENGKGWLGSDLKTFWQDSHPYFQKGISALEIQEYLGLYLDQILLKLYKLRTTGLIVPKRVFTEDSGPRMETATNNHVAATTDTRSVPAAPPSPSPIDLEIDQLAMRLEPIWDNGNGATTQEPPVELPVAAASNSSLLEPNLKQVTVNKPTRNVINHLMQSIWNVMSVKK